MQASAAKSHKCCDSDNVPFLNLLFFLNFELPLLLLPDLVACAAAWLFFAAALAALEQLPTSVVTGMQQSSHSWPLEQHCCNTGSVRYLLRRHYKFMPCLLLATADSSLLLCRCILHSVASR